MKKIHFIGIGGISMSTLALELKKGGAEVSGSDITLSHITKRLSGSGIKIYEGHAAENIAGARLVVKNSAIKEDNPELAAARKNKIDIIDRAELLGLIMAGYKTKIAVAGMHGKTTATGLTAAAMGVLNPTVHIGGEFVNNGVPKELSPTASIGHVGATFGCPRVAHRATRITRTGNFITEACEYCRSFLYLSPDTGVVLNIDEDHLDYFKDINDIICAYEQFAAKCKTLIINGDDEHCRKLKHEKIITFGFDEKNDYQAADIVCQKGKYAFTVKNTRINLNIFGRHQVYNALAAFAAADLCGLPREDIKNGIESFCGIKRRFELYHKKLSGADVIIDYAHHPKEIKALISATREAGYENIYCVFQPHTYTRTEMLLKEFAACFDGADEVILMPVYAAREKRGPVDSLTLLEEINRRGGLRPPAGEQSSPLHIADAQDIIDYLKTRVKKNDAVLIAGAGSIVDICQYI